MLLTLLLTGCRADRLHAMAQQPPGYLAARLRQQGRTLHHFRHR
ncbi:hypothetical protein OG985_05150 [Streptomyces sp. NBC_00289]